MWGVEIAVMLVMVAMNSVFAGYEIALASVSLTRLHVLVEENCHGAKAALYMKENMEASLAAVQLGITLFGAIAAATGGAGAKESIAPYLQGHLRVTPITADVLAISLVVLPLTVITIMFGELVPKVFALRNKEWLSLKLSPFMRWFVFSVWPAVWLFETSVTTIMNWGERRWRPKVNGGADAGGLELKELLAMASVARALRLIGSRQEGIILGAATLSSRPVRDIMLPAEHINMLHINATLAESLITAHLEMHTRFPVTESAGDPQAIIGYVSFKDIVAQMRLAPQQPSLRSILRPLPRLSENTPIARCLEALMRQHTHIALVCDHGGKILGMITLEDILEELVGDIQDEFDRLPSHALESGAGWIVGGGITLDRFQQLTGVDLTANSPENGALKLTDWVAAQLDHPPQGGDTIERNGLRLVVRKVRRKKVLEAQATRSTATPTG
jgi:putative hemolysin